MKLDNKVAIVTGSGQGLGFAYAQDLARHGAAVVINDVDRVIADAAVSSIVDVSGRAVAVVAPVGGTETAQKLVAGAVEAFGRLDVMVTNAGILRDKVIWKMTDEDSDSVVDVHLRGTFACVREAAIHFRGHGEGGRVVCIGSPADAAGIVSFLASDASAEVTGQAFAVGGDRLALRTHPDMIATSYHDGGWSADDIAAAWNESFAANFESVGENLPVEPAR